MSTMLPYPRNRRKGFTIVELIIVIAVIGVLAAILIPTFSNVIAKANNKSATADAKNALTNLITEVQDQSAETGATIEDTLIFVKKAKNLYVFGYSKELGKLVEAENSPIEDVSDDTDAAVLGALSDMANKSMILDYSLTTAEMPNERTIPSYSSTIIDKINSDTVKIYFGFNVMKPFSHEVAQTAGEAAQVTAADVATVAEIQAAINNPVGSDLILQADLSVAENITIPEGKSISIDLNGHKLIMGSATPSMKGETPRVVPIINRGTLTISNGTIDTVAGWAPGETRSFFDDAFDWNLYYAGAKNCINNYGNIYINNVTMNASNNAMYSTGTAVLTNCVMSGYNCAFWNEGKLTVNGGTYTPVGLLAGSPYVNDTDANPDATVTIHSATLVFGAMDGSLEPSLKCMKNTSNVTGTSIVRNEAQGAEDVNGCGGENQALTISANQPTIAYAINGTQKIRYANTWNAFLAAQSVPGSTIRLETDCSDELDGDLYGYWSGEFDLTGDDDLTIDLNGHKFTMHKAMSLARYSSNPGGKLTIKDTSAAKDGQFISDYDASSSSTSRAGISVGKDAEFVLESGSIVYVMKSSYAIGAFSNGKITINGGKIVMMYANAYAYAISLGGTADLTVNGGEIEADSTNCTIKVSSATVSLTITGGKIVNKSAGAAAKVVNAVAGANCTYTGGTFILNGVDVTSDYVK